MPPAASPPKLSRILLSCLLAPAVVRASSLIPRQAQTCGGLSNLQQCGSAFPSSFCCPKDSTCVSLHSASVQSVICCPAGSDCAYIQPITCDITQLNATLHPDNQIHLSETDSIELSKCGEKCCPLGYTCKSGMCSKNSSMPSPSASVSAPAPSSTKPVLSSQSSNCSAIAPQEISQGFSGRSFAAGFFSGIIIGSLITLGLLWAINKHRDHEKKKFSGDFGHVSRQISDPIYDPATAARTDFIRRGSQSAHNSPQATEKTHDMKPANTAVGGLTPKIKSMWERTPKLNFGFTPGLPASPAPVRAGNSADPLTTPPPKQRRKRSKRSTSGQSHHHTSRAKPARNSSQETIDVLMPAPSFLEPPRAPGMRSNRLTTDSSNTTFTKLMERAGFDDQGLQEVREWNNLPRHNTKQMV